MNLKNRTFDLAALDTDIRAFYDNNKQNNDIEFITDFPYSKCVVNLDEQQFMYICNNFIANSIKYTNRGYIKYGYSYENDGIKIYVKDTGIGIAQSYKNELFKNFSKPNDNIRGSGLGLANCKTIVEMQNGKIGFESKENVGSTFWAWFPTDAEIEFKTVDSNICKNSCSKYTSSSYNNIRKNDNDIKILVAEDTDSNYLLLKVLLRNYTLTRAINGKEALEIAKTQLFDLILMDIRMPIMDGIEATKLIRKFNKDVKIIALTANAFDIDTEIEKKAGCDDVIIKPITKKGRELLFSIIQNIQQ